MLLVRISAFFAEVGNNIKYQILDLETERLFFFCVSGPKINYLIRTT